MSEPQLLNSGGWTFRWLPAASKPTRLLVLVHGLTGDENSMWMLVHNFPSNYSILAPRAPYPASGAGYTWRKEEGSSQGYPTDEDLLPAARRLVDFLISWRDSAGVDATEMDILGFSQGAGMVYLLGLLMPAQVRKMAVLSGFLPSGLEKDFPRQALAGKTIFVSHGQKDDMVPVEKARRDVALLKGLGVNVTYCESDAGHKVSRDCLIALEKFFR
jgi:phospholipase/carboxylesterase